MKHQLLKSVAVEQAVRNVHLGHTLNHMDDVEPEVEIHDQLEELREEHQRLKVLEGHDAVRILAGAFERHDVVCLGVVGITGDVDDVRVVQLRARRENYLLRKPAARSGAEGAGSGSGQDRAEGIDQVGGWGAREATANGRRL